MQIKANTKASINSYFNNAKALSLLVSANAKASAFFLI
ncbi:unnamed protein product, partial [Rotaria sordida]